MQNVFQDDLQTGSIDKEQFEKTLYVRINNEPKIKELQAKGYVVIKQDPSSDLILFGLSKKKAVPVEEPKNVQKKKA